MPNRVSHGVILEVSTHQNDGAARFKRTERSPVRVLPG